MSIGTREVLRVLKIGECNLITFKTRMTINQEMREQLHNYFVFLVYSIPPLCLHSNFCVVLYKLFMHSSLTNQKRDILLSK